ncbi:hypothetical protein HAU32_10530 [Weissella confusa]|uniref:Uncharacterized protein n=1 Tax=Weissella fermenti TaxID=2987699 RepID=A0ABT6D7F9_9LACO|nr:MULTISPECIES: hypothetical protein [Weissella]MBJ7689379.1 hypothetical protein [Weissella confusa]MCW0928013.1 hypothetical protein [Weissella sp. LMG 11983]MDF9300603.1 hypothetical protein [Weissella sp. BK2]
MAQITQSNWVHIVGCVVHADLDMSDNGIIGKLRLNFGEDYEMHSSYVAVFFEDSESPSNYHLQNFENLIGKFVDVAGYMKFNPTKLNKSTIIFIAQSITML